MDERAQGLRERMFRERHNRFLDNLADFRRMERLSQETTWNDPRGIVPLRHIITFKETLEYLSNFLGDEFKKRCAEIYDPNNVPEQYYDSTGIIPIKKLLMIFLD